MNNMAVLAKMVAAVLIGEAARLTRLSLLRRDAMAVLAMEAATVPQREVPGGLLCQRAVHCVFLRHSSQHRWACRSQTAARIRHVSNCQHCQR